MQLLSIWKVLQHAQHPSSRFHHPLGAGLRQKRKGARVTTHASITTNDLKEQDLLMQYLWAVCVGSGSDVLLRAL